MRLSVTRLPTVHGEHAQRLLQVLRAPCRWRQKLSALRPSPDWSKASRPVDGCRCRSLQTAHRCLSTVGRSTHPPSVGLSMTSSCHCLTDFAIRHKRGHCIPVNSYCRKHISSSLTQWRQLYWVSWCGYDEKSIVWYLRTSRENCACPSGLQQIHSVEHCCRMYITRYYHCHRIVGYHCGSVVKSENIVLCLYSFPCM